MLVLSRRLDEEIVFPGLGIRVTVLGIDGGRIKVGIEAPPTVKVLRGELASPVCPQPSRVDGGHKTRPAGAR